TPLGGVVARYTRGSATEPPAISAASSALTRRVPGTDTLARAGAALTGFGSLAASHGWADASHDAESTGGRGVRRRLGSGGASDAGARTNSGSAGGRSAGGSWYPGSGTGGGASTTGSWASGSLASSAAGSIASATMADGRGCAASGANGASAASS